MKDAFYVVLPSNSSMQYFPKNTTTHFLTQLPKHIDLNGKWAVALTEIQYPQTCEHIQAGKNRIRFGTTDKIIISGLPTGFYNNIDELITVINEYSLMKNHIEITKTFGGYTQIALVCDCDHHLFNLDSELLSMIGHESWNGENKDIIIERGMKYKSFKPASIARGISNLMFVYTDIVEHTITGDVQTPLLQTVPVNVTNYDYGSIKMHTFSKSRYIPLLRNSFQTIEIDIRDQFGEPIPFQYGTVTVTLHFKRYE